MHSRGIRGGDAGVPVTHCQLLPYLSQPPACFRARVGLAGGSAASFKGLPVGIRGTDRGGERKPLLSFCWGLGAGHSAHQLLHTWYSQLIQA